MKKIYALSVSVLLAAGTMSQNAESFESFVLSNESYDNGSSGNGNFVFGDLTFTNEYNSSWSTWNGFSVSNMTDNTTPGYINMYSSYTASGYNSSNYLVFYPSGNIMVNSESMGIDSFKITNTAYAAIAMRDGDSFSKQFGSPNDAGGNPDGTNGEDFLKVWIIGSDYDNYLKDSVEFYLADFQFADNNDDYIVDSWENIDLTEFGFLVANLSFRFESSDVGQWGINTPLYFAMDDVSYTDYLGLSSNQLTNVEVYPVPVNDVLNVNGEYGMITLTDIDGKVILHEQHDGKSEFNLAQFPSGVYFLQLMNEKGVFTKKILK
jgi:hypothetical protein